jgi:hypothetical protein
MMPRAPARKALFRLHNQGQAILAVTDDHHLSVVAVYQLLSSLDAFPLEQLLNNALTHGLLKIADALGLDALAVCFLLFLFARRKSCAARPARLAASLRSRTSAWPATECRGARRSGPQCLCCPRSVPCEKCCPISRLASVASTGGAGRDYRKVARPLPAAAAPQRRQRILVD